MNYRIRKQLRQTLLLAVLGAAALLLTSAGHARNVSAVTVNWAPHYGETMTDGGALTVITREAFRRGGHRMSIAFIPWSRALKNVQEGRNDIVMGAYYNDERAQTYIYSDPVYNVDLGLVALDSLGVTTVDNLRSLTPYTIGVSRGFANTDEFDSADFLNKETAKNPTLNLRKLFRNRVDMVVGAFDILRHEARLEDLNVDRMVFIQPPLQSNALYIIASRNIDDGEQLIEDFNRGLTSMRQDGTLARYLQEYLNRR